MPRRRWPLLEIAVGCHALLAVCTAVLGYETVAASPWRELACLAAAAPLGATLPGLVARRSRALVWLALLLVVYAGGAITEVVASAGGSAAASGATLAAVLELGLLPTLSRSRPRTRPVRPE